MVAIQNSSQLAGLHSNINIQYKNRNLANSKITPLVNQQAQIISFQGAQALKAAALSNINFTGLSKSAEILEKKLLEIIENDKLRGEARVILSVKDDFVRNIVNKITNNPNKRLIIGLTGESASGKSTYVELIEDVANGLKNKNSDTILTRMSSDNYYIDRHDPVKGIRTADTLIDQGYSFDVPDSVDLDKMCVDLKKLANGEEVKIPEYKFGYCISEPDKILKKPAKIILEEGIFALNPKLDSALDAKVYVHTDPKVIRERWLKRAEERGNGNPNQYADIEKNADLHIRPLKEGAGLILNGQASIENIKSVITDICKALS